MMNYIQIDENHIQMSSGIFGDVTSFGKYPSGEIESIRLAGKNMVVTHAGEMVPAYTETPRRKNKPSVEFYKDGMIKGILMEEQTEVLTPIGELPAEHVTFYPTGEVHRVFITDGQISGFWSEEDEKQHSIPLNFSFDFTEFTAYLNGLCFYKDGSIKSVTLFPGEKISIETPAGVLETGIGFSLYENGDLKSVEPIEPILINTPIGDFMAYDPDAVGVHADTNSMCFDEQGRMNSFKTVDHKLLIQTDQEEFLMMKPLERMHSLYDDVKVRIPITISFDFDQDTVKIVADSVREFSMKATKFIVKTIESDSLGCTPIDCATCSLCNS